MQEFSFPDAVRMWDTLFSDGAGRTDCLLRMCVAMLVNVRAELLQVVRFCCPSDVVEHVSLVPFKIDLPKLNRILVVQGDFAANLKLLQRYPPVDVHAILHVAEQLGSTSNTAVTS